MQWLIDLAIEGTMALFQGMILMWSGAIVDIPEGWALCDGTQGTPDLRNRFIAGAGDGYNPDDSGGVTTHRHSGNFGTHQHQLDEGSDVAAGTDYSDETDHVVVAGFTAYESHRPPYYALAYIMRL